MKNTKFFVWFITLFFIGCGATVPIRFPKFPDGTQGTKLRSVLEGKKKVGVVAKELNPAVKRGMDQYGLASEWSETIRAAMKTQLEKLGYYVVVDIDARNERYNELARTQTGITKTQKALGQELAIDHLFFVNMTAVPRVECKIENLTDPVAASIAALQLASAMKEKNTNQKINTEITKPTGVLYLTVFVEGTLVNVETGKSVSYSVQEPYRLENQVGNTECPSELVAFNKAIEIATFKIGTQLSPIVVTVPIPLEDSDDTVQAGDKKIIEQYLKDGIKWIEAGDSDQAEKSWESALEESGGTSKSAYWNLATIKWYKGDMEEAKKYFDLSIKMGGPKFLNDKKRKIIAIFNQEKKRIEEEND